jgi:hypothetical protein
LKVGTLDEIWRPVANLKGVSRESTLELIL